VKIQKNGLTRQRKKFSFEQQHSCSCNYEETAHQFHNEKKHDLRWRWNPVEKHAKCKCSLAQIFSIKAEAFVKYAIKR